MYLRWPIAKAVKVADATTVVTFLYEEIFCIFGPFTHLLSYNGTHFDAQVIDTFLVLMRTHHKYTSGCRPQCNGMVKKLNGTLTRAIQKLTLNDPQHWDMHLPSVLWAYRTKVHETLRISPYQLLFGQDPTNQDPFMQLGQELGSDRYAKLVDRNRIDEL
ncbi:hypothetical protein [Parasitella parasitica]|uniref:Integrase catalytic domain-containing protein n=1 Tax=Parasitella parasitica TaxID=35722 RepID=A0A0B7MUL1_9FUNG|nr:hypothetical protein [Parasitella parasitica]